MTCVTMSAQTTGSFHAAACQKPRQHASRCQGFVLSQVSALRLSRQGVRHRPPATRNRSRALPAACHSGTAPVARSAPPPASPVRIRQRMMLFVGEKKGFSQRRGASRDRGKEYGLRPGCHAQRREDAKGLRAPQAFSADRTKCQHCEAALPHGAPSSRLCVVGSDTSFFSAISAPSVPLRETSA
jgi:hypothetical protein